MKYICSLCQNQPNLTARYYANRRCTERERLGSKLVIHLNCYGDCAILRHLARPEGIRNRRCLVRVGAYFERFHQMLVDNAVDLQRVDI